MKISSSGLYMLSFRCLRVTHSVLVLSSTKGRRYGFGGSSLISGGDGHHRRVHSNPGTVGAWERKRTWERVAARGASVSKSAKEGGEGDGPKQGEGDSGATNLGKKKMEIVSMWLEEQQVSRGYNMASLGERSQCRHKMKSEGKRLRSHWDEEGRWNMCLCI